ncbi:AEC family transporter [Vibrio sinensis]|uniref:AEC family transporter n=1 Tax=Vibrio sinensis TaxID=2302434 RepID=A0A3A6QC44_9VIBR|nr:AEC family transporter [Vibrio sinensis]RJX68964.1 AEC family transporter [Vibrio sinensis]
MLEQIVGILFPVFALVVVGFIVGRFIKPNFQAINRINMDAFTPALVFSSLVTIPLDHDQLPLLFAALFAILIPALVMWPICRWFGLNFKAWTPPHMFRNSGNLAIPLFTYTFGEKALAPAVILFVIAACTHLTIGLAVLSSGNPLRQIIKMPIFIAALIALCINISGISLWAPLYDASVLLGQAAVPVMLISLGGQMCNIRLSGLRIGLLCTVQSLLTGAIAFACIYYFIPLPTMELQMMLLFTMLPPAVMNYLFAERFNIEPVQVASMVLFSNFFCIFTLPLLLLFALSL